MDSTKKGPSDILSKMRMMTSQLWHSRSWWPWRLSWRILKPKRGNTLIWPYPRRRRVSSLKSFRSLSTQKRMKLKLHWKRPTIREQSASWNSLRLAPHRSSQRLPRLRWPIQRPRMTISRGCSKSILLRTNKLSRKRPRFSSRNLQVNTSPSTSSWESTVSTRPKFKSSTRKL